MLIKRSFSLLFPLLGVNYFPAVKVGFDEGIYYNCPVVGSGVKHPDG